MSHDYNTRTKKQEEENNTSAATVILKNKLLDGFSSLKHEVINLKDVIIGNLQEENAKLRNRTEVLQHKFNHLEQHGKRNNTELSGNPD